jgi:spermidine synthase
LSHPSANPGSRRRLIVLLSVFGLVIALQGGLWLKEWYRSWANTLTPQRAAELGVVYLPSGSEEIVSEYSQILIKERGAVRELYFVREDGSMALESRMDILRPHQQLVTYTQTMFSSYLFLPRQKHVLIVGLGAGSMVRFLEHHEPDLKVDVVEIDPVVIEVARDFFGTRASPTVQILERDGFDFLKTTTTVYDVVYMDAFLKPSEDTDASGTPLRLKTKAFLRGLQERVHAEGLVVFNVNELDDLDVIRDVFAQTYVFQLRATAAAVAVGTSSSRRLSDETLRDLARDLDARFQASFSFVERVDSSLESGPR